MKQAVIKIFKKETSVAEWGTFASNAIVSGNINATRNVLSDGYDKIKDFFQTETDAFIISATSTYFNIYSTDGSPKRNQIPEHLTQASVSKMEQRGWLHGHIANMIELYVSDSTSDLSDIREHLIETCTEEIHVHPCRQPGCPRTFKYAKCCINHEKSEHNLITDDTSSTCTDGPPKLEMKTDSKEDHIFNYGCLRLSLGLLLRNAEDAVKEGDGCILTRVWKFLTFLFRFKGHNKYALAGLRLIASLDGLLSPRQAHKLMWNRFAGKKEGNAKRIPRDLRLEQINKVSKEEIRALGIPNLNSNTVQSATHATGAIEKMIENSREDLEQKKTSGFHTNKRSLDTFQVILDQVHNKAKMFTISPGREYKSFPKFRKDLFRSFNHKQLHKWITKHKRKWHRLHRHLYRF